MEIVNVHCTNTDRTVKADVLNRSDKSIKVAIHGSNISIPMSRADTRKPYVGHMAGMEFTISI